jgi:hypothetical protein
MTHKVDIVRKHLQGMECKEIARQTMHCEDAVGQYVDDFERVVIALAHRLPSALLSRVLKLGAHVVDQYVRLCADNIGGVDEIRALLVDRGVLVDEAVS